MPKDTSENFFNEATKPQATDTANPDIMGKWVGVAEKGINLIDQIVRMRTAKQPQGGGESSAYEKGMSAGLQQASAKAQPTPQPAVVQVPATLRIDSEGAEKYLFDALTKADQTKTLKQYIDEELTDAKEMGVLRPMIETFIKNFSEIKQ